MTTFVSKGADGLVRMRLATATKFGHIAGRRDLRPDEQLFGKAAEDVAPGVYTDAGEWIGTHEEWLRSQAAKWAPEELSDEEALADARKDRGP